jgi:CheY-like chemotaxis protein
VQDVTAGSPARGPGCKPYDLITAVDGEVVRSNDALIREIAERAPGSSARLELVRDGRAGAGGEAVRAARPRAFGRRPHRAGPADASRARRTRRARPHLIEIDDSNAHRFDVPAGMTGLLVQRVEERSAPPTTPASTRGQSCSRSTAAPVNSGRRLPPAGAGRPGGRRRGVPLRPRPRSARHSHRPPGAPLKPRILVIDDESSIRDTLRMILEYEGYDVLQAATGDDAVRLIEREAPDLVFLDIKMPGMDGLEVLQKVRHLTDRRPSS